MTLTDPTRTASAPIKGWSEDPGVVRHQVTHAVEPGHLVALCGIRVVHTGDAWSEFTGLSRCSVCRAAALALEPTNPLPPPRIFR